MASYGEHKTESIKHSPYAGETETYSFAAFSIPAGEVFYKVKITNAQDIGNGRLQLQKPAIDWKKEYTDKGIVRWSKNGDKPIVKVKNISPSKLVCTVKVTFITKYTKVVKGNKIVANDRAKCGSTTDKNSIMTDHNFTRGTLITADSFNSKYGYTAS